MAIHEVHTCLKGFIKLESFGYNLKGFFNFGDRELTDHEVRLLVNYGIEKGYRCENDIPEDEVERILKEHENDQILTIHVKKEWFDKIVSGEKTEEYRQLKDFWIGMLIKEPICFWLKRKKGYPLNPKKFTHVLFINGYRNTSPRIEKEFVEISIDKAKQGMCPKEWVGGLFFVIKFK